MGSLKASDSAGTTGLAGYRRIEIELRKRVAGGQWAVGAMLPSRRDLARQYAVSLVTLDRAIGPLLADGILRADDRRGTFVAALPPHSAAGFAAGGGTAPLSMLRKEAGTVGIVASFGCAEGQEYDILHELEQVLSHKGCSTVVLNRAEGAAGPVGLAEAIQAALRGGVDALVVICLGLDRTLIARELRQVAFGGCPAVCVLAGELNLSLPHVFYDNRTGGYQAAQHLAERGWEDITVVAPFTASWVTERIAGIRDAVSHAPSFASSSASSSPASSPAGRLQVLAGAGEDWDSRTDPRAFGYRAVQSALASGWSPSGGIIGVNDGVAFGVLDAAAELGLVAGRDFAILGFDDEPQARVLGLTSLRPPMQGMAREAARLLLDHVAGNDGSLQVRLRAQVIPRASTGPRRPGEADSPPEDASQA